MRACRELTELGMEVARAAAREAVANLDTPIEHPTPGAHLPPVCRVADPGRLFTRAAHAVRQAIALENRIVAGDFAPLCAPTQPRRPGPPNAQPATPRARQTRFQAEPLETFNQQLFETDDRPAEQILAAIRQALGLGPNPNRPPRRPITAAPPPEPAPSPAPRRAPPRPPPRPG